MKRYILLVLALALAALPFMAFAVIVASLNYDVSNNYSAGGDVYYQVVASGSYVYLVGYDGISDASEGRFEKRNASDGSLVYATTSNPSAGLDGFFDVAIDGTYAYLVGYDNVPGGSDYGSWFEKRNLSDGSLVYATTSNPSAGYDPIEAISIDDTYAYLVSYDNAPGNFEWRFEKRNLSDGLLVYATTSNPSSGNDFLLTATIDSQYWYAAGEQNASGSHSLWRIEKRNLSDGSLVYATTSEISANGNDAPYGIDVDDTFMYVVGANRFAPGNGEARLQKRYLSDGSLVYSTSSNPSSNSDYFQAVKVDGLYLYAVGADGSLGSSNNEFRIEKRRVSNGELLYGISRDVATNQDRYNSVDVDGDTLYLAGFIYHGSGNYDTYLTSYNIDPTPTISSLSPVSYSKTAGDGAFTLTVNGTYFSTDSVVRWNGSDRVTSYVSPTQVTASILAADIATAGTYSVTVKENTSDGNESVPASYVVDVVRVGGGGGGGIGYGGSSSPAPVISPVITPVTPQPPVFIASPISHFRFDNNLKLGTTHPDVQELQKFLNSHGFLISSTGPGSLGNESSFFGPKTYQALIKFQEANADSILKPNNLKKGTGFFGASTRAFLNGMLE